jgi:hypothetical protein
MNDTNTKKTIQELIIDGETYVFNATYLKDDDDSMFKFSDIKTIVQDEIAKLVGSAPDELDTLIEISSYIQELEDRISKLEKTINTINNEKYFTVM